METVKVRFLEPSEDGGFWMTSEEMTRDEADEMINSGRFRAAYILGVENVEG